MKRSVILSHNPEYRVEKFDDEILLYAMSSTKGVYLNDTAHLVWEMCGQGHSVEDIVVLLEDAYPDQRHDVRADVLSAVESLKEHNALVSVDG